MRFEGSNADRRSAAAGFSSKQDTWNDSDQPFPSTPKEKPLDQMSDEELEALLNEVNEEARNSTQITKPQDQDLPFSTYKDSPPSDEDLDEILTSADIKKEEAATADLLTKLEAQRNRPNDKKLDFLVAKATKTQEKPSTEVDQATADFDELFAIAEGKTPDTPKKKPFISREQQAVIGREGYEERDSNQKKKDTNDLKKLLQKYDGIKPEEELANNDAEVAQDLDLWDKIEDRIQQRENLEATSSKPVEAKKEKTITVAGQTFKHGQTVVYTHRPKKDQPETKGFYVVHIDDDPKKQAAPGNIVLRGMRPNKRGKMQEVTFAIPESTIRERLSTDLSTFDSASSFPEAAAA